MVSCENRTVCAVSVAYRNPGELRNLLESLARLARPLDGVIVVDNSEDPDVVRRNRDVFDAAMRGVPYKRYIVLEANAGSAFGYAEGMKRAYAEGFDWIWLLDQDGTADVQCLADLLEADDGAGVLCPNVVAVETGGVSSAFRGDLTPWGNLVPVCAGLEEAPRRISGFATHGVMIGRSAIAETGYYDGRNFFCGWEDHDYSLRLRKHGMPVLLVPRAVVYHPDLGLKYEAGRTGKLAPTSRLYIRVSAFLPLPVFLGVAGADPAGLATIRQRTRLVLLRKHLKGLRMGLTVAFSLFCLCVMKLSGKRVPFADTCRMYADMVRGRL